jgi:hypothetical protein
MTNAEMAELAEAIHAVNVALSREPTNGKMREQLTHDLGALCDRMRDAVRQEDIEEDAFARTMADCRAA